MRIIGKTENGRLLIDADPDEVANLCGFYYRGTDGAPKLEPGMTIQVHAMFQQLYALANNAKRLGSIASELRAYADRLEMQQPIVNVLIVDGGAS